MLAPLAIATFFALLALPGLAALRRFQRPMLGEGVLAAIGPSYLASFALLTPVSVLGYALRWPITVLAVAYVVAVSIALLALWPSLWSSLRAAYAVRALPRPDWLSLVVGLLVAADMLLAARVGGHPLGDGHYHLGRVRSLLDYGFQSWDPRSAARSFDAAYHTNLYHARLATAAKLTGLPPYEVWAYALPWTKLLSAAAIYRFALVAVGKRSAALVAVACAVLWSLSRTTFVYPNALAPYALLPLALSFGLELGQRETRVVGALGLGLGAIALAQVHTLYYVFLCIALGPCLLVVLGVIQRDVRALALSAVLLVGAPWLWQSARRGPVGPEAAASVEDEADDGEDEAGSVSEAAERQDEREADEADDEAEQAERASGRVQLSLARKERRHSRGFVPVAGGLTMLDPSALWHPETTRLHLVLALGCGLLLTRRRQLAMLAGVALTLLLVLHVPWLCTPLVRAAGAPWIVRRLIGVQDAIAIGTVPAVLAYLVSGTSSAWPRLLLALTVSLGYGQLQGIDARAWKRKDIVADAISGKPLRRWLGSQRRRSELLADVPSGAVLVTTLGRAPEIAGICDCYPLAFLPEHGNHGMFDMAQRRVAQHQILDPRTPLDERLALMRRFGTRHIHLGRTAKARKLQAALGEALVDTRRSPAGMLFVVDTTGVPH